ncbi:hypothetical protein GCM10023310_62870 [Paenibacillus vulneris]|uniref:Spore coat protein n=1 Tax=Paenibacillus vulneris TaxID=1133364 RepID=A0ABW3ULY8_9BACL
MYQQQNYMNQPTHQHTPLQEQDWGNLVLSELKRTAREYTTAALEATHPAIRQTFQSLSQRTMQEQAELYQVLSQLNGYGSVQLANQQEIHQEIQQQVQKVEQLQSIVQRSIQSANMNAGIMYQQQPMYNANPQFQQQPSFSGYEAGGYAGMGSGAYQQPSSQTQGYGQGGFGSAYGSSVGSSIHSQGAGFGSTAGSGMTGMSQNQNPISQSIANEYTGSAYKTTSAGTATGTSTQSLGGSSTAKYGSGNESYSAVTASDSRGGNSYNWTDDNAGAASSSAAHTTSNRGGNSFDWHDSDDQSSASSSLSASHDKSSSFGSGKFM